MRGQMLAQETPRINGNVRDRSWGRDAADSN
jgi:hypothetical protein